MKLQAGQLYTLCKSMCFYKSKSDSFCEFLKEGNVLLLLDSNVVLDVFDIKTLPIMSARGVGYILLRETHLLETC